jgi:hypothetical protein
MSRSAALRDPSTVTLQGDDMDLLNFLTLGVVPTAADLGDWLCQILGICA